MSGAVTAIGIGAAAVAGVSVLSSMMAPSGSATVAPPEKPPQGSKSPDYSAFKRRNAGAVGGGGAPGGTFLTGVGGVKSNDLSLGKNDLLGG